MKRLPGQKPAPTPERLRHNGIATPYRRVIEFASSSDPVFVDAELNRVLGRVFSGMRIDGHPVAVEQ